MSLAALPRPGVNWGSYPERHSQTDSWLERMNAFVLGQLHRPQALRQYGSRVFATRVRAASQLLAPALARDSPTCIARVSAQLHRDGLCGDALVQGVALVSLVCSRHCGFQPFDTQLRAAYLMLHGCLAEMATGEGKTYAVMLVAGTAALAGVPVHAMSSNDYLVARDAQAFTPIAGDLGLRVGVVTSRSTRDERMLAYSAAVTYVTAREVAFDYLRDRLASGPRCDDLEDRARELTTHDADSRILRGLCMCVIDEADSVLLDDARTPFLIAMPEDPAAHQAAVLCSRQALTLAGALRAEQHFLIDASTEQVRLLPESAAFLERRTRRMAEPWNQPRRREELVSLALHARHVLQRDRHYIIQHGRVEIVDSNTGRIAHGQRWSRGIHRMVELKEGCIPQPETQTAARLTFQRLFRRYHRLCGVSGTISEAATELIATYQTPVSRIPLHRPSQRRDLGLRLLATEDAKWSAVATRIEALRAVGRPVLVGTGSVAASEALAARLTQAGIEYQLLNARQDADESRVVAAAGQPARVTVATNMAGRGTDIRLADGVADLGGLHVINTQVAPSRRIDRQLIGRGARQGDPGSFERIVSLQEPLLLQRLTALSRCLARCGGLAIAIELCQRVEEFLGRRARARLTRQEEAWQRLTAFGVRNE
jgi:preprotein translocase subunit SecA